MNIEDLDKVTPNDFYKKLRPEYFSDSETIYKIKLPKETLAYEIESISVNQKQDQFESLARKLAEKFIAPNLIPQVGPTGGGDGKTDSETHPVSESISDKWYVVDNGWDKDENWAFAISSKEDWRGKLRSDIKSILSTKRGYAKIFFISNRKISSKKKKDAQDKFSIEFNINTIILDGEWIIEKIINNDLIDLVVDSLGMSDQYKEKNNVQGANDTEKKNRIEELESDIETPNRYFKVDYQLIEDCLQSAILSREIEDSREIIEGKFLRALRFAKKLNNTNQLCRIYYQRAWTAIFWYNDFEEFAENFKKVQEYTSIDAHIDSLKLYTTLFTVLKSHDEMNDYIDVESAKKDIYDLLLIKDKDKKKPTASLTAKTWYNFLLIQDNAKNKKDCEGIFYDLNQILSKIDGHLGYPFDTTYEGIMIFGKIFPESKEYDKLLETLAELKGKRDSDSALGYTLVKRAFNKYNAKLYKDAIIFLGKVVVRFSKDKNEDILVLSLRMLSDSYRNLGLLWASHNCLISACSLSLKTWFKSGYLDKRTYYIALDLARNEVLLGRIPSLLSVSELIGVLAKQIGTPENKSEYDSLSFIDISLANRLLNSKRSTKEFEKVPDALKNVELEFSSDALLYILGYEKEIIDSMDNKEFNETELNDFMSNIISQPIKEQFLYETNFLSTNEIKFRSKVLGTQIEIVFSKDKELFSIAETILAYIESFCSTFFDEVIPTTETINISLEENVKTTLLNTVSKQHSNEFTIEVNKGNFFKFEFRDKLFEATLKMIGNILDKNFLIDDTEKFIENIFKKEEVHNRIRIIYNHNTFMLDFYGVNPKVFFEDWYQKDKHRVYENIRKTPLNLKVVDFEEEEDKDNSENDLDFNNTPHNKRKVYSVIDNNLWDKATWQAFGFLIDRKNRLGLTILFENIEAGRKIFEGWKKSIGDHDKNNKIRLSIVKGINKQHPYWYRVCISSNIDKPKKGKGLFLVASRFHELNANTPENLNKLIELYKGFKHYTLYPAHIDHKGDFTPDLSIGISKSELIIKDAWEIAPDDPESIVIKKGDNIIIPKNIKDAPVLEVLKLRENRE